MISQTNDFQTETKNNSTMEATKETFWTGPVLTGIAWALFLTAFIASVFLLCVIRFALIPDASNIAWAWPTFGAVVVVPCFSYCAGVAASLRTMEQLDKPLACGAFFTIAP
jgi:hypothetical protein